MNNCIKSPFNWVGNKYKYLDDINNLIKNKSYDNVIDIFMGSGNILLNISCEYKNIIGNDKVKLLPMIFSQLQIKKDKFVIEDIEKIINKFNRFKSKEDYYSFRTYWNKQYISNDYNGDNFVLETILLLKMCSNSMIRFNLKGEFNQGFRGVKENTEFFTESSKKNILIQINELIYLLNNKYKFINYDFKNIINIYNDKNNLLIIDPPYSSALGMYGTDWKLEDDEYLFNFLSNCNCDFIYFNYLERNGIKNDKLEQFIKNNNLSYKTINNVTNSGQNRLKSNLVVNEIIVTNIK